MDLATGLRAAQRTDRRAVRTGIVRALPASNRVTVEVDTVELSLPFVTDSYAVGDTVVVAGGYVLGRLGTPAAPPPPPPDPAPQPTVTQRRTTVLPQSTGTWRAGKWRDTTDLYQGDYGSYGLNTGAAYYGNQLVALGADLAQPRSAVLTYRRQRGGVYAGQSPTLWTLTERARAGAPSRVASAAGTAAAVDQTVTWQLPQSWVDDLLSGARGGLGVYVPAATPYVVLDGRADHAAAFALTVTYYS